MKRVAITGATGMIGSALIELCVNEEVEVYAFCRRGSDRFKSIIKHPKVHVIECALADLADFDADSLEKCDVFYHFGWEATIGAGRNDDEIQNRNIQYTLDAVNLAQKLSCKRFVGAGSQAEYGPVNGMLNEITPVNPQNAYGKAKLIAGEQSRLECERLGMEHIWTRILSVYGPRDSEKTMISMLIRDLLKGNRPKLTKGEQKWDYLYCEDAARALFLLGEKGNDKKTYCIGSGNALQLLYYINVIRDMIAPEAELGIGEVPYADGQIMYLCADISELTKDTGFVPKVRFEEGIKKTIEWIRVVKHNEED